MTPHSIKDRDVNRDIEDDYGLGYDEDLEHSRNHDDLEHSYTLESASLLSRRTLRHAASRLPRRAYLFGGCTICALLLLAAVFTFRQHNSNPASDLPDLVIPQLPFPDTPPSWNSTTVPGQHLEIVVSHYDESLSTLRATIGHILSLSAVTSLDVAPKITVYTKHPTMSREHIASGISQPHLWVHRLPNLGREGGTYLTHLLRNYDQLATHTLFLQASVHNERQMLRRLSEYFVAKTGFLSIGFSGEGCALGDCVDAWGWRDVYGHLPALYAMLYGALPPAAKMSLSFKGQFVVSRRRVKGVGKEVLEGLQKVLEGEESEFARVDPPGWSQGEREGGKDNRGAPSWGYTLERAWGLVFRCADGRLVESCGNLWAKRGEKGLEACQCLDVSV